MVIAMAIAMAIPCPARFIPISKYKLDVHSQAKTKHRM